MISLGNIGVLRLKKRVRKSVKHMIYRDKEEYEDKEAGLPEEAISELLDGDEDEEEKIDFRRKMNPHRLKWRGFLAEVLEMQ
jgi:hypothetical protein